jgi:tripartite-type tricarboxylate transporter receptor subunit TctC
MVNKQILTVTLCCAASAALAQSYPQRLVRVIVNVSTGGGVDILARNVICRF